MKNKLKNISIFIIIIISFLFIFNGNNVLAVEDIQSKKFDLYTINAHNDLLKAGTNRGNMADRQNIGIYMPKGSTIKIKQTDLNYGYNLTLDLLANDRLIEKSYTINKDGSVLELTAEYDGVPFIRTPRGGKDFTNLASVEVIETVGTKDLIYYTYGMNEDEFFDKWNNNQDAFAVMEGNRTTFLVPLIDKDKIIDKNTTDSYKFKSLDELLKFYDDFVAQYDLFLGLYMPNEDNGRITRDKPNNTQYKISIYPEDRNFASKEFIKADINGYGAAYYLPNYTAQHSSSMSAYFQKSWLPLHEFAHGYEGSLAGTITSLDGTSKTDNIDVINNIYAYYYQQTFLKDNDSGWLGKISDIEESVKNKRDTAKTYNDFTLKERLYMFVNLLNKLGPQRAWGYVNQQYRMYLVNVGNNLSAADAIVKYLSEYSGYNLIPYFEGYNIQISDNVKQEIENRGFPELFYLRDLVETDEEAKKIANDLHLDGMYSLISKDELELYYHPIETKTPYVSYNGHLTVDENKIKNQHGEEIQLRGFELDGTKEWHFIDYTPAVLKELKNNWKVNCIKVAMDDYPNDEYNGYVSHQDINYDVMTKLIDIAKDLDIYIICNWHTVKDANPVIYENYAKEFFEKISSKYGNDPHIIYELWNKSNINYIKNENFEKVTWKDDIKPYSKRMINVIRNNAPDSLILVETGEEFGTNEELINSLLDEKNVMYTVHFYSDSEKLNNLEKLKQTINKKVPLFVSELEFTDQTGIIGWDEESGNVYLNTIDENNISWINSLFANGKGTCVLNDEYKTGANINDYLTNSGKYFKNRLIQKYEEDQIETLSLDRIKPNTTLKELKETILKDYSIMVVDFNGNEIKDADLVGTGMNVKLEKDNKKFKASIVVIGDITGDRKSYSNRFIRYKKSFNGCIKLGRRLF